MTIRASDPPAVRPPGEAPADNLYRGLPEAPVLTHRDGEGAGEEGGSGNATVAGAVMTGHFAVFNVWTEICSWYEGEFLERLAPGCLTKTIRENLPQVRVQYDHGCDDWVGGSPLGPIDSLVEDDIGAAYEVPLLDTDYNRDRVLPLLQGRLMSGETRGSLLGASFRFRVVRDEWNMEPDPSAYNPKGQPERTILEVRLFEFGPVVFPAYPAATAGASVGMRSLTDHYLDRLRERRSLRRDAALGHLAPELNSSPVAPPAGHPSVPGRSLRAVTTNLLALKEAQR